MRLGAGRIPSLDGLRAISISLVILAHLQATLPLLPKFVLLGDPGRLGVRIFFVISGFLITTLLLEEYAVSTRISLPWFYFRRTLRIFPAAYAFIAVVVVLHKLDLLSLHSGDTLHALTYTMNYHLDRSRYVGHLWSLSVEEQFYLLWPLGIARLGPARALWLAGGFFFAAPLFRTATWFVLPAWRDHIGITFLTVCDELAIGCVLALVRDKLERHHGYVSWLSTRAFLGLPLAIFGLSVVKTFGLRVSFTVGDALLNLMIALWIHRSVYVHTDGMGRFLNWRPCRYVGRLSYSLYIWQQLFLNGVSGSPLAAFPINLLCVANPCLEWRQRMERLFRRKSSYPKDAGPHLALGRALIANGQAAGGQGRRQEGRPSDASLTGGTSGLGPSRSLGTEG